MINAKTIFFFFIAEIILYLFFVLWINDHELPVSDHKQTLYEVHGENFTTLFKKYKVFEYFGAYKLPDPKFFNAFPGPRYTRPLYGIAHNETKYCQKVDKQNFENPWSMFNEMRFVSDYDSNEHIPRDVMRMIGFDTMPQIYRTQPTAIKKKARIYDIDKTAQTFVFKVGNWHVHHRIGTDFLCVSQMYNHIPGHGALTRKSLVAEAIKAYSMKFIGRPQCFNKKSFFPYTYRLYDKTDCMQFFEEINSAEYKKRAQEEPNQYIIKKGHGAHQGSGVFLLDDEWMNKLTELYGSQGEKCGVPKNSLLAQAYVANALLYHGNHKFDFRLYFLVASTNPLIAYYHDGFLRVSLVPYDVNAQTKNSHFTNTHFAQEIIDKAEKEGTYMGKTAQEWREFQGQSLEQLQDYLIRSGKVEDENWLDNYLRPTFMKALAHLGRAVAPNFRKQPNVWELFGVDFMLDDELNLWFIEANMSPQILGTNAYKSNFQIDMWQDIFEITYSYYRSRMKRVLLMLKKMNYEMGRNHDIRKSYWRNQYKILIQNKIEPEFKIRPENKFKIVIDKNIPGPGAYHGYIPAECADD